MNETLPLLAVYADESCLGNGRDGKNPGGAGVLVEYQRPSGELVRQELWVSERATTNNRMALRSVIETFRAVVTKGRRFRVRFCTDSRYIVDGMSQWVHDWAARGWKRKAGAIENLELWHQAVKLAAPHQVEWFWVRGHAGHAQNEYANDLAVRAASELTSSNGLVPSRFDEWLHEHGEHGRPFHPEPFPESRSFKPSARLPHSGAASPSAEGPTGSSEEPR
jgi:ribonuclease HI